VDKWHIGENWKNFFLFVAFAGGVYGGWLLYKYLTDDDESKKGGKRRRS
jgi:hypothetical protein